MESLCIMLMGGDADAMSCHAPRRRIGALSSAKLAHHQCKKMSGMQTTPFALFS